MTKVAVHVMVPADIDVHLRALASQQDRSKASLVRQAIESFLKK